MFLVRFKFGKLWYILDVVYYQKSENLLRIEKINKIYFDFNKTTTKNDLLDKRTVFGIGLTYDYDNNYSGFIALGAKNIKEALRLLIRKIFTEEFLKRSDLK